MITLNTKIGLALLTMAAAAPALAGGDDWRDRRNYSPREASRSWDRVQEQRRDLERAQWQGDEGDVRDQARELRFAEREFFQGRGDLYRAGWDDDRRGDRDDNRFRGDREDNRFRGGYDDDHDRRGKWDKDDRRRGNNGRGWGPGGRPGNDPRFRQDGWNQPGWHAEQFYVNDGRYRQRYLGNNHQVWRGYDNRYYCRRGDGTTGLIIGGLGGGTLGNILAPGGSKLLGSIIGGTLGAVLGNSIDRRRVVCR